MLDLESLVGELQTLASEVVRSAQRIRDKREAAFAQLQAARGQHYLRPAVLAFKQEMAIPAESLDMGSTYPVPAVPDYTIIATDGSQVAPDFHHVAPWYVINTGCAVFRYGAPEGRERCRLSSRPLLRPPTGQPAPEPDPSADARAAAVSPPGPLEVERLEEELRLARELLDTEADPGRSVLLLDGPLVQWRMVNDIRGEPRKRLLALFRELLDEAQALRVPIAGFISRSRAVEWITLLRFSLCPNVASAGKLCDTCNKSLLRRDRYTEPPAGAHHAPLAGLRDVQLAADLLFERGSRTEVIELVSSLWTEMAGTGSAGFFYLNTGREIARVELPSWVWEDKESLDLLHAALWDQCEAGLGYPMVLSEAHEAAVVRGADREAFYTLVERVLEDHGVDEPNTSAKALSKRRPLA